MDLELSVLVPAYRYVQACNQEPTRRAHGGGNPVLFFRFKSQQWKMNEFGVA